MDIGKFSTSLVNNARVLRSIKPQAKVADLQAGRLDAAELIFSHLADAVYKEIIKGIHSKKDLVSVEKVS